MYKFIEIKTELDKTLTMLKVSNNKELLDYIRFFSGRAWAGAKVCVERIQSLGEISHLGGEPEATVLKVMAECEADEKGNYQFHPLKHSSKLVGLKWEMMASMLERGDEIVVNENGGCCDLKSFLETHKAKVTKEFESSELVYPKVIDQSKTYKTIILENDNEVDYDYKKLLTNKSVDMFNDNHKLLNKLKLRSREEIYFFLSTCKEIITKTTFLNQEQVLTFVKLFSKLRDKEIKIVSDHISTALEELKLNEDTKLMIEAIFKNNKVTIYNSDLTKSNYEAI